MNSRRRTPHAATSTLIEETSAVIPPRRLAARIASLSTAVFLLFANTPGEEEQARAGSARVCKRAVLGCVAVALGLFLTATPAQAAPSPRWQVSSIPKPTNFTPLDFSGKDIYEVIATNVGDAATDGTSIAVTDTLPPKLTAKKVQLFAYGIKGTGGQEVGPNACTTAPLVQCTYPGTSGLLSSLPHGEELIMRVWTEVHTSKPGILTNSVSVAGGGAPKASSTSTNEITAAGSPAPFGIEDLELSDFAPDGTSATQAGSHPYELTTTIALNDEAFGDNQRSNGGFRYVPTEDPRNIVTELPPGFVGNPQAVPRCSIAQFASVECPIDTQVGTSVTELNTGERLAPHAYNVAPQVGNVAVIGLEAEFGPKILLTPTVRTGGDYGLRITSINTPLLAVEYVKVTIWGVPADPSHDFWRGRKCGNIGCSGGGISSGLAEHRPFLTNPTSCTAAPLAPSVSADSWENPGNFVSTATSWPAFVGCNQLQFEPTIRARPTTNVADSPSGLDVELNVPQNEAPEGLATANLRDAKVTLPQGMTVNPSSANGLGACTEAEIDLHGEGAATCPNASKLGTVEVDTPLLDHPLPGFVYLAKQGENPFHSLLALYLAIDDPQTGVVIKLPGKVIPDPQTGQLTASFEENPQLPFEDFKLHFFGGAQGALRTPATCGSFKSTSDLTPWSSPEGEDKHPSDSFETTSGANGGPCPHSASEEENKPRFHAGTETPQAGAFSPFSLKLVREDGSQELQGIDTILPPGLVGRLAGIPYCSDAQIAAAETNSGAAEKASPSCPLASEVGTVNVGAGAGPDPYYVQGHAYLAGPYKGAPLSLAILTPAVAGPFDLGTVVVRVALYVNPESAQIHAVSDPIPTILQGIPLDVRSITLKMNRPNFTLNPTSCDELGFTGSALSVLGVSAPLTQRFQVGGCNALKFKPALKLSLKGGTKRHTFPALKAVVTYPKQGAYANIAKAQVTLPASENLEQGHINKTCLRGQLASHTCPASSIYGHASAVSPLLDQPLSGPVYLATGFGYKLPALVADLGGQIEVLLAGKVDTGREDGLRNSFEVVPDAPVSKFTLSMFGGKKGLIVNKENICGPRATTKALAKFVGQNGKAIEIEPTVHNSCKKGHKKGKNKKRVSHRVGTSHR